MMQGCVMDKSDSRSELIRRIQSGPIVVVDSSPLGLYKAYKFSRFDGAPTFIAASQDEAIEQYADVIMRVSEVMRGSRATT